MSVLLDEETVVLSDLDFRERCETKQPGAPEHTADVMLRFRCCGEAALLCLAHVKHQRESVTAFLALGGRIKCGHCSAAFTSWEDGVEVVPL